jgi:hypothetical protein
MKSVRPLRAAVAAGLGLLACDRGGSITEPPKVSPSDRWDPFGISGLEPHAAQTPKEPKALSPFSCALTYREAKGSGHFRTAQVHFGIPKRDWAADGSQLRYVLRVRAGNRVEAAAYCIVPNTPKARSFLDHAIGHDVQQDEGAQSFDVAPTAFSEGLPVIIVVADWTFWYPSTPNAYWWGTPGDWDNTSHDTGGGPAPDMTPPAQCSQGTPGQDSLCLTQLLDRDRTNIINAIAGRVRTSQSDTALVYRCLDMANTFMAVYNADRVYRGAFNTNLPPNRPFHYAEYDPNTIKLHFEPWLLDSAATGNPRWIAQLANTALHEAAHILGHNHPDTEGWWLPGDATGNLYGMQFTSDWFSDLNHFGSTDPEKSCIIYP